MKKKILLLSFLCIATLAFGQPTENQKLIELSKVYNNLMFRNEATKSDIQELQSNLPENLKTTADFIVQTITTHNKLLTLPFLCRPKDNTLKQVYIIRALSHNMEEESKIENIKLIDSLSLTVISTYELLDNYYEMLFMGVGNKNQPFNLSKTDLKLNEYNLKDDTEQGIFVLEAMAFCGTTIWGYMNVAKPANTKKGYEGIKKFPKINGHPYYQYTDFYFPNFEMIIEKDKGLQSYKTYYINKFYEALLSHLICLNKEGGSEKEKMTFCLVLF